MSAVVSIKTLCCHCKVSPVEVDTAAELVVVVMLVVVIEVVVVVEPRVVVELDIVVVVVVEPGIVVVVVVNVIVTAVHVAVAELVVVVELEDVGAVVVVTLVRPGQIPLLERRALGYNTLGSPLARVTVRLPAESVVYAVQLITSTNAWFASKPVADDGRLALADDEAPTFVKTPTICDPELPLRIAMVWLSE